jgi:hypothetical protein
MILSRVRLALRPIQLPFKSGWGRGASFPGIKWQGSEVDHSPPPSAVMMEAILPLPMSSWYRDNFTFLLTLLYTLYTLLFTVLLSLPLMC